MQTSLESPRTRMFLHPFSRAYLSPNIIARYSATLLVAVPTPSRNIHICMKIQSQRGISKRAKLCKRAKCIPRFHRLLAIQLLPQLSQDFLLMNHRIQEYRSSAYRNYHHVLQTLPLILHFFVSERHYYEWYYRYIASVQVLTHFRNWLDLIAILIDQTKMKRN